MVGSCFGPDERIRRGSNTSTGLLWGLTCEGCPMRDGLRLRICPRTLGLSLLRRSTRFMSPMLDRSCRAGGLKAVSCSRLSCASTESYLSSKSKPHGRSLGSGLRPCCRLRDSYWICSCFGRIRSSREGFPPSWRSSTTRGLFRRHSRSDSQPIRSSEGR